mgnify:CR=1 FL=1
MRKAAYMLIGIVAGLSSWKQVMSTDYGQHELYDGVESEASEKSDEIEEG